MLSEDGCISQVVNSVPFFINILPVTAVWSQCYSDIYIFNPMLALNVSVHKYMCTRICICNTINKYQPNINPSKNMQLFCHQQFTFSFKPGKNIQTWCSGSVELCFGVLTMCKKWCKKIQLLQHTCHLVLVYEADIKWISRC